jgi:hypothetical protein
MVGFCEHGNEPSVPIKKAGCLTSCVTISFPKNILHHGVSIHRVFVLFVHKDHPLILEVIRRRFPFLGLTEQIQNMQCYLFSVCTRTQTTCERRHVPMCHHQAGCRV